MTSPFPLHEYPLTCIDWGCNLNSYNDDDEVIEAINEKLKIFKKAFIQYQTGKSIPPSNDQKRFLKICKNLQLCQYSLEKHQSEYENHPTKENKELAIIALTEASEAFHQYISDLTTLRLKNHSPDYSKFIDQCLISLLTSIVKTKQVCYSEQLHKCNVQMFNLEQTISGIDKALKSSNLNIQSLIDNAIKNKELEIANLEDSLSKLSLKLLSLDMRSCQLNFFNNAQELKSISRARKKLFEKENENTIKKLRKKQEIEQLKNFNLEANLNLYHSLKHNVSCVTDEDSLLTLQLNKLCTELSLKIQQLTTINYNFVLSEAEKASKIKEIEQEILEISKQLDDLKRKVNDYAKKMLVMVKQQADLRLFFEVVLS